VNKKKLVLVVDNDPRVVRFIRVNLESEGYRVRAADDADTAEKVMEREMPDMILFDLELADTDGVQFIQKMRSSSAAPIIAMSGKKGENKVVNALKEGADDFVTKPFNMPELLARIEAVLRRSGAVAAGQKPEPMKLGELTIDLALRNASMGNRELDLTLTEYKLLAALASNTGRVMHHKELLTSVWGAGYSDEWEYLRTYVSRLRRKLEADPSHPKYIVSRPGFGYVLRVPDASALAGEPQVEQPLTGTTVTSDIHGRLTAGQENAGMPRQAPGSSSV